VDATTRETVLYGQSISEPHLHTFHALFCALKIGLIVQVYPEIRMFLWSFRKLQSHKVTDGLAMCSHTVMKLSQLQM